MQHEDRDRTRTQWARRPNFMTHPYGVPRTNWDLYKDGPDTLPRRTVAPAPPPPVPTPSNKLAVDVAERMERLEVDAVRVECRVAGNAARTLFDVRLEFVGDRFDSSPWLSMLVNSDLMLSKVTESAQQPDAMLLAPWTLPLVVPVTSGRAPCVLVWHQVESAIDCGRLVADLLLSTLDIDPTRVRVSAFECPPLEAARRQNLQSFKHELRGIAQPRGQLDVLSYCVKCGQPLRDPRSARIGIGPECLRAYSAEQLWVARNRTREMRFTAKRPAAWIMAITSHWKL